MKVNIEFFDTEPLENIVTCLHFKMDKVIFFGQADVMTDEAKEITKQALIKNCNVSEVSFREVSMKDIDSILQELTRVVQQEEQRGNQCFFDLTGGADMLLVAMGMFSATHNTPMHRFDIADGELKILNTDAAHIDTCAESQKISLTIQDLVQLHGGVIAHGMQKKFKENLNDLSFRQAITALWQVASANMQRWNGFSAVLKATKTTAESVLNERLDRKKVKRLADSNHAIGAEAGFLDYLKQLEQAQCIENLTAQPDWISFRYKSARLRNCLLDAGSVLEMHTYYERLESDLYDECKIGTHLKWGVNATDDGYIVNNEIDVLLLRGYVLTFISCKGGSADQMDLYELDTVASRFGGKYAQKELVTVSELDFHHRQRAEEMGISVVEV